MTEGKSSIKSQKSLLALNPEEDAEFQKKIRQVKGRPKTAQSMTPGVLYVAHLPRGLFEPQLKAYFKQFGTVLRVRVSRSKKTGGTKGYGFVEFECDEVAKIVAETMNNYLMRERLIKCELIPPEKVHEKLFAGSQAGFKKPKHPAVTRYNRTHEPDAMKKLTAKLLRKESKLRKRLAAKGIDYDFPGFSAQVPDKKVKSDPDVSVCSEDVTPVCTPSLLERRKSIKVEEDDEEIVIKPVPENFDDIEDSEEDSDECEEEDAP
ncbi:MKI67 FHA domain-interacting nucleolar phosphoprotein [Triplophysa dalaica]|uniref:MKI67 FHA domain-interacting nucleolar phosphoprotein n=1 Tax=Triplophysa dalaica TaxID=1582913 RepID=UPI0024E00D7D|nr:MKI67 FHA domain-interacting nucleolar phosphoprotein [Triplophysa dalaica]